MQSKKNSNLRCRLGFVILAVLLVGLAGLSGCDPEIKPPVLDGPLFISGTVNQTVFFSDGSRPIGVVGVQVTLVNKADDTRQVILTAEDGTYRFEDLQPGEYSVVPAKQNWRFDRDSRSVTITDKRVAEQDFTGSALNPNYLLDPWGAVWDAEIRTADTWLLAAEDCQVRGGRLPTATELYRNRFTNNAFQQSVFSTSTSPPATWLVTQIRNDHQNYVTIRLSDGDSNWTAETSGVSYRCIWPARDYDTFRGGYIYTLPGQQQPYQVKLNGGRFFMDQLSRPRLTYDAALSEASFYYAAIPSQTMLGMAIQDGLNYDDSFTTPERAVHWTSDMELINSNNLILSGIVYWDTDRGSAFTGSYSADVTWGYIYNSTDYRRPFRLIGVSEYPVPVYPDLDGQTWFEPCSRLKADWLDGPSGTSIQAIAACFEKGGHLPTTQELVYMIRGGLPNGRWGIEYVWSADFMDGPYVGLIRWPGTDPRFTITHATIAVRSPDTTFSWAVETTATHEFRTTYFPIDPEYAGPDKALVDRNKLVYYEKARADGQVLKIWIDAENRTSVPFYAAMSGCYKLGGELVSVQDILELVRADVLAPNSTHIWTSDYNYHDQYQLLAWPVTGSAYFAQHDGDSVWSGDSTEQGLSTAQMELPANFHPYRCIWTNELRTP